MDCFHTRICEHCAQVRADSKESKALQRNFRMISPKFGVGTISSQHNFKVTILSQHLEYQPVDYAEHFVGVGVQDDTKDNEPVKEHGKNISKSLRKS